MVWEGRGAVRGRISCTVFMRDKTHPTVEETWSVGLCVMVRGALGGLCLLGVSGDSVAWSDWLKAALQ